MTPPDVFLDKAVRIADEVLFPAAMAVDSAGRIPPGQLDLLAAEGFYALAGPPEHGGLAAGLPSACRVIEVLASGCLATTFVWLQHHGAVRAVAAAPAGVLRSEWLGPLCGGARRAGVALGGALPGAPLRARPVPGGYRLDGVSPWVTGWGMIDTVHVAARDPQDAVVTALIDAEPGPAMAAEPLDLVAVMASRTVQLGFSGLFVPSGRVTGRIPYRKWQARDAMELRRNGSLALGVVARCCRMIGASTLDGELVARRAQLDAARSGGMPAARAAAAELAMRSAAALVTTHGSRAILVNDHAQRLAREALFLLVFGSRPAIRESLAGLLIPGTGR